MIGTLLAYAAVMGVIGCQPDGEPGITWLETNEEFGGGATTVSDVSVNAFGNAAPNLTGDKDLLFVTGNSFFNRNWVTAPSSTEDLDGLGPMFIARSCSSCHFKDGRGAPPAADEAPVALLFRLSVPGQAEDGGPQPEPTYGSQLSTHAILGTTAEGSVQIQYEEITGQYADGTSYHLRKPRYTFTELGFGPMDPAVQVSPRVAQHMIGLGLLEAIDEVTLTSLADPDDRNGDGISGRINRVWDVEKGQESIGRYGWKANQPSVRQQVAAAFVGDIGITSSVFPTEECADAELGCQGIDAGEPELKESILNKVVLYSSSLAVPKRRNWDDPTVLKGKQLFVEANCSSCHVPKLTTGTHPDFPEFSNETIRPFTDLLLHDMGEGLADGRPDFLATGSEWRTPPLWGIGLIETVNGHTNFLHDGRARNLEEAILWHGGEAEAAKKAFLNMSGEDRRSLVTFLTSL
ncbi:di-heme oxidoredictase family protein [Catalinimonas alkaloidigena]|uniref:di-heme oxidoreductase family protein n=1 Tax=Catalinimonas alkaloidigena TaxID=1075417 RepID=UPI001FE07DF7|nr:di-heme oxidoredictase family protein [Catalinimonas alkaloidigena]